MPSTQSCCRTMLTLALTLWACSEEEKPKDEGTCSQSDPASCAEGLICEQLGETGETYKCLPPVLVSGRVYDALSEEGIAEATVVGLDANGAARTRVARTSADGRYELPVSMLRAEDGSPVGETITLRVAAADHQPFPKAPRSALPIELSLAVKSEADAGPEGAPRYRVENAATEVALIPLPEAERTGATVEGSVAAEEPGGVLVLALHDGAAASSAISDMDGSFVLFNVPTGSSALEGYRAGLAVGAAPVDVPATGLTGVVLSGSTEGLSTINGSINIVDAAGGLTSSVILVVASTFDPNTARGEAPAGLRAAPVSGAFKIEGVPPGRYAALAAFENDELVRDPDEGIAGTAVVFVDVPAMGGTVDLSQSFKVTGALAVVAPGAEQVEEVQRGPVTLSWNDDSSEDGYELRVYDALGSLVHEDTEVPRVTGSSTVEYTLDASSFLPGMLYQFRVWSFRERTGRTYISASEDLKGLFEVVE